MAQGSQFTLTAAGQAVVIATGEHHEEGQSIIVTNSGANPAALGGPGVTASGYTLAANATLTFTLADRDILYAFSTLGTTLQVLTSP